MVRLPNIRRAQRADAAQLSALAEQTFRDAFAVANAPQDMDLHCRTHYGEALQAQEITDPNRVTLLCEHDGRMVGFAQLRWGEVPDCIVADTAGEILRLYVIREFHGKSVAQELMQACMQEMTRHRSEVVWLGVWEHNSRAIAFYGKFGFVEVGEHVFQLGNDPQRDILMARHIAAFRSTLP